MEHANLFNRLLAIFDELESIDKVHPIDSSVEAHPQVSQLMLEAKQIVNELDPVIRVVYRGRPNPCEELEALFDSIEESNLNGGIIEPAQTAQEEETDPQAEEMIRQDDKLTGDKPDPIELRDHLEELAEWERHIETYYNLDKKDPDKPDS